jgi:hypothetical protein
MVASPCVVQLALVCVVDHDGDQGWLPTSSRCLFGWGEQGHGAFGQVAAVADLPFVVS